MANQWRIENQLSWQTDCQGVGWTAEKLGRCLNPDFAATEAEIEQAGCFIAEWFMSLGLIQAKKGLKGLALTDKFMTDYYGFPGIRKTVANLAGKFAKKSALNPRLFSDEHPGIELACTPISLMSLKRRFGKAN